jgi:hypothetical protein
VRASRITTLSTEALVTISRVLSILLTLWLAGAAVFALVGTNTQARLSRERLLADDDPLVAEAGRLWTPYPRWLSRPGRRRRRTAIEVQVRLDPERAKRYDRLRAELVAWNALESSVALAFAASIVAVVATIVD